MMSFDGKPERDEHIKNQDDDEATWHLRPGYAASVSKYTASSFNYQLLISGLPPSNHKPQQLDVSKFLNK